MTAVVVGGAYRETCREPGVDWVFGSGVRAAAVMREAAHILVTVADVPTHAQIPAVLGEQHLEVTPRVQPIEFAYDTPLSVPQLRMHNSDCNVEVPPVDAGDAVVFGMVEARPVVAAQRLVVDPQHSLSLDQVTETVSADELIVVANRREIATLAGDRDLQVAVDIVARRTGAAGVVVKAGALGALVYRPGERVEGVPALVTPKVFPIGSGDVFTAALAMHYFENGDLTAAAHFASRTTAGYVTVRHLGPVNLEGVARETFPPTIHSVEDPPWIYVAASFANPEQRWSGRVIDRGIDDIGGRSLYPLREVGEKEDAEVTAKADLESLDRCDSMVLLADVARTGPFFEAGWATSHGLPIVVMNSDTNPDRYTMLEGTGAKLVSDLATAAYQAVWAAIEHRDGPASAHKLMLLSGGLDSAAVAALERPERALFVDYGQIPAQAERRAARAVAQCLDLELDELVIDLAAVGSGQLTGGEQLDAAPTSEWFPFRNQHLATIAAAHALLNGLDAVVLGIVAGDGDRHADGTPGFRSTLDTLVRRQEGGVRVLTPHINTQPHVLLERSGLTDEVLNQTHSCHASNLACGECPGCERRAEVLECFSSQGENHGEAEGS
ncbi:MAG: PfkB family carbohydrate kinase [Acidimicrobiaceae bacterium]|nr:PfkB family carbohydrate kinase [Acidimicrobiaceae bacterium]